MEKFLDIIPPGANQQYKLAKRPIQSVTKHPNVTGEWSPRRSKVGGILVIVLIFVALILGIVHVKLQTAIITVWPAATGLTI